MEAVGVKPQSTRRNSQLFPDRSSERKKKRVIRQTFTVSCDSLMTGGRAAVAGGSSAIQPGVL